MTEPTLIDHLLLGLILLFGGYAVFIGQPNLKTMKVDASMRIATYWANGIFLWLAAAVTVIVWIVLERPIGDLGLTFAHDQPVAGLLLALLFVVLLGIDLSFDVATPRRRAALRERWKREIPFLPESRREYAHFSFIAITAGVTEEIIARGFLISYLASFLPDSPIGVSVAVGVPALAFAAAHWYQGFKAGLRIVILGVLFGAMFVVTGSLLIPILLHAALDLVAGALAYWVSAEERQSRLHAA